MALPAVAAACVIGAVMSVPIWAYMALAVVAVVWRAPAPGRTHGGATAALDAE
jgi:hypothetical protein